MTEINDGPAALGLPAARALSQGMERYVKLMCQQAELGRQLAVGWAGAMQTLSGIMLTQTGTIGQLVAVQTEALADQTTKIDAAGAEQEGHRRPVLGLIQGSATRLTTERETSPAEWAIEQEHLRFNVFDEVVARLLEDDIEEAVV